MNVTKIATAVTFAAVLVLTGCSNDSTPAPAPATPTATATATAEPTTPTEAPEPTEVPAPVVGETINTAQLDALAEGQRAYEMADGSLVVIDDAAPLPEAVFAEMTAPIAPLTEAVKAGFSPTQAGDAEESAVRSRIAEELTAAAAEGRSFYYIFSFKADAGTFYTALKADGKSLFDGVPSKDEAIRKAQETADARNAAGMQFTEVIIP